MIDQLREAMRETAFEPLDRMAYLALTSKIEGAVRDNVAWFLHKWAKAQNPRLYVAREWNSTIQPGLSRVDLALLRDRNHPELLVEFKTMYDGLSEFRKLEDFVSSVNKDFDKRVSSPCQVVGTFIAPIIPDVAPDRGIIGKYGVGVPANAERIEELIEHVSRHFTNRVEHGRSEIDHQSGIYFLWWIISPPEIAP